VIEFRIEGLDALRAQLRELPASLAGEGGQLVAHRGDRAGAAIRDGYPARTRDLRDRLEVLHRANAFGARAIIINRSRHALPFEYGTQARHTQLGSNRGAMPPNPLFSSTVARERRGMWQDLSDLLVRAGLTVTGHAG